jgi:beta-N-acetylhexosaminidase
MMGMACYEPIEERAWKCIESGTDCYLFSHAHIDMPNMRRALREKKLSEKRVAFAARKILELKARVGLFDNREVAAIDPERHAGFEAAGAEIARRSITLIRDVQHLLPLRPAQGARVLTLTLCHTQGVRHGKVADVPIVDEELRRRGFRVDHEVNLDWLALGERIRDYEIIFVNLCIPPRYGTTRLYGEPCQALWGGFLTSHPKVLYTSFGDPYKLYEMPYAPSWLNAYSDSEATQRAVVKVWLGEAQPLGKSPVTLPKFFEAGV